MGLDGIEIVMSVEEEFGISLSDAEVEQRNTPRKIIDLVYSKVSSDLPVCGQKLVGEPFSMSRRAFKRVQSAISDSTGTQKKEIQLDTRLLELFGGARRRKSWRNFQRLIPLGFLVAPCSLFGREFGPKTVSELVRSLEARNPTFLTRKEAWTRGDVAELVRHIIREQTGLSTFSDDDELARDLGID